MRHPLTQDAVERKETTMTLYGPTDSKFDPMVEMLRARIDRLQAAIRATD